MAWKTKRAVMDNFYSKEELRWLGIKSFGKDVLISRSVKLYSPENMVFGDNVRIDDYCVLSGSISLGSHIHIAVGCYLFAGLAGIYMEDFTGLSSRCSVYAVNDDYSGQTLTNPTISNGFRDVISKAVIIEKHSIIGTNTIILPDVTIAVGTAIWAMSLVTKSTEAWSVYYGQPARKVKTRSQNLLELEPLFIEEWQKGKAKDV